MRDVVDVADLHRLALRYLPDFITGFVETGGRNGDTLRHNMAAFAAYRYRTRSVVDLSRLSSAASLFGREYALPVGISAVGNLGLFRRHGDEMLAEVAQEMNIPFMLSGMATSSVEQVARHAPRHVWYQLYAAREQRINHDLVRRARDAGVDVLVVTVDFPVPLRNTVAWRSGVSFTTGADWRRKKFSIAWDLLRHWPWSLDFVRAGGLPAIQAWASYAPAGAQAADIARYIGTVWPHNLLWPDLEAIRALWPGKLVVKGLCHVDEIRQAEAIGADAVTVSNHGGNKLDSMCATLDAMIEARPHTRMPLLLDGGIRSGDDIFKAMALGANFCFVGRAALYAIAAGEQAGAIRLCEILRDELRYVQAMTGNPLLGAIAGDVLVNEQLRSARGKHGS